MATRRSKVFKPSLQKDSPRPSIKTIQKISHSILEVREVLPDLKLEQCEISETKILSQNQNSYAQRNRPIDDRLSQIRGLDKSSVFRPAGYKKKETLFSQSYGDSTRDSRYGNSSINKSIVARKKETISSIRSINETKPSFATKLTIETSLDTTQAETPPRSFASLKVEQKSVFGQYSNKFKSERLTHLKKRLKLWFKFKQYSRTKALERKKDMERRIIKLQKPIQDLLTILNVKCKNEFDFYKKLIYKYAENPDFQYKEQVFEFIQAISNRISEVNLSLSMLQIFKVTTSERSFVPAGFLFQFEIDRLDFSENYGCLINMNSQKAHMIIGIFLIIQILCGCCLYKPWDYISQFRLQADKYYRFKQIVQDTGSVLYFLFLEQYQDLPKTKRSNKNLVNHFFNIAPQSKIHTSPEESKYDPNSNDQLVAHQNCLFYESLMTHYEERIEKIKKRFSVWIRRIYKRVQQIQIRKLNNQAN